MRGTFKKNILITMLSLFAISGLLIGLFTYREKYVNNKVANLKEAQDLVALTYNEVNDDSVKTVNTETGEQGDICEFVEFNAFFTQDLNNDGIAERVDGACRNINDTAQLYFRFTVLSKGYLKNGKIKINGENFKLDTAIPVDTVISKSYIEPDTKQIDFVEKVQNGTQKIIASKITPRISNINDYSKSNNTIVFEGTYVYENDLGEEVEVPVKKICNLTVDWYGTLETQISKDKPLVFSNENIVNEESGNVDLEFSVKVIEKNNYYTEGLILDSNVVEVKIPQVKGYSAINAKVTNENINFEYDEETGILRITRKSTIDENGNVTASIPYVNEYNIVMTYPAEIYDDNEKESLVITVPVESYYTGYNNPRAEFDNEIAQNIAKSNVAQTNLAITYENPKGDVYEFKANIGEYITTPNKRYVVSKKETIKAYNNVLSEEQDLYEVRWTFLRGNSGNITKAEMQYTNPETLNNDSFDKYTTNVGIYFEGATTMLGQNGYIKVYDADKNGDEALLATFYTNDWEEYNKQNPYIYDQSVKNIRVEISESNKNSTLVVHHVKEINNEELSKKYTEEEFESLNILSTYLTGKVYDTEFLDEENRTGVAYYEDEKSVASISINKSKIATTETNKNEIITIKTQSGYNKSKWQNSEFIVAMPQGISTLNINSVTCLNDVVEISGYNVVNENGTYLIKIVTKNDTPLDNIQINIDCDITPDSTLPTTTDRVSLYAYNQNYESYDFPVEDVYDTNNNGDKKDIVGFASDELQLVAPTGLITYQTATDYNDDLDDEKTMAPNVAEVTKEQRTAQINIDVLNNYSSFVTNSKILGKIPYQGNTYVITDGDLESTFTTKLASKVELSVAQNNKQDFNNDKLQQLQGKIKVYYSENEKPTNDISLSSNGWIAEEDVADFSKMKSYLIDLGDFNIDIGDDIGFKYTVSIPEGVEYEKVSYSEHAVYFDLNTPDGLLADYTEPNKLGIKIVRKYNLNLTKNVLGKQKLVKNALYLLETGEKNKDSYKAYIELTDENGSISLKDLYVEKVYKLTELKCEDDYEVADGSLEFKVIENEQTEELEIQVIAEGAGYNNSYIENNTVNISVQDKVRFDLNITKYRSGTDNKIAGIDYLITAGEQGNLNYEAYKRTTNDEGVISLDNLYLNKIYTVEETKTSENFAISQGKLKFRIL